LLIGIFYTSLSFAQQPKIIGKLVDIKTGKPVEFANLHFLKTRNGTTSDENGSFSISQEGLPDTLSISSFEYLKMKIFIDKAPTKPLIIQLKPIEQEIDEVQAVGYRDPGRHIIQMVIAADKKNDINKFNNSVYNEYCKTEVDVVNIDVDKRKGYLGNLATVYNKFSSDSTANIAPVFFTEKFFRVYHSNNLQTNVEHEISRKELGLSTDQLGAKIERFDLKVNFYDAIIPIFKTSFLGPASNLGLAYYKFTPVDTVDFGKTRIIELDVKPKFNNENTFFGKIWIDEYTWAITKYDLTTSAGSNINFVKKIRLRQNFVQISNQADRQTTIWVPKQFKMNLEFGNGLELLGLPIEGDSTSKILQLNTTRVYGDYIINSENLNANNFFNNSLSPDSVSVNSKVIQKFDDIYRLEELTPQEKAIYQAIDSLKNDKKFIRETKLTAFVATGYWDFGCKLRVGPYSSLLSTNQIEGLRIRSGFWTLPCVSKTFNFNGYAAYGFNDNAFKGGVGMKYVPETTRYMKTELYVRSDYDALGEFDDALDKDNVFTLALRKNIPAYQVYNRQIKLIQEIDLNRDWSVKIFGAIKSITPTFDYSYLKSNEGIITDFTPLRKVNVNEVGINFRYGHNERTTIFNYDKLRIYSAYPVINIGYIFGFEGTKNTFFEYHKITANISQEITLPIKGSLYYSLSAGQMFGTVPAILLFAPTGNAYYISNRYTFNNMIPYEFAADKYASLMLLYNMGGILLNKAPLLNKLKLRERVIFNSYIGTINQENRYYNSINSIKSTVSKPYSEVGIGIGNIFNVLSIDAIWRLSQLNNTQPYTRFGIYVGLKLLF